MMKMLEGANIWH